MRPHIQRGARTHGNGAPIEVAKTNLISRGRWERQDERAGSPSRLRKIVRTPPRLAGLTQRPR